MPPLHPGDPGEGGGDEGDTEGAGAGFRPPLPPEDRLWRHPSEVARARAEAERRARRRRSIGVALVSGGLGAVVAAGALALLGGDADGHGDRSLDGRATASVAASADPVEEAGQSVASLRAVRAGAVAEGAAVAWRGDGHLVTDAALVQGADRIEVRLPDGRTLAADVVGADDLSGVAVVHVEVDDLPPAPRSGAGAAVGDRTVLLAGSTRRAAGAVADDGRSGAGSSVEGHDGEVRHGMLVVAAPFPDGSAGGAVVDDAGALVGIATALRSGDGAGGVVIPVDLVRHVADQILAHGHARHVWLGLHGHDDEGGARVDEVVEGGPAHRAGIRTDDLVVAVDGEPTPSMASLIVELRLHLPGDVVTLKLERGGATHRVEVDLGAREAP